MLLPHQLRRYGSISELNKYVISFTERIVRRFKHLATPVPDILLSADTISRSTALSSDRRDYAVTVLMSFFVTWFTFVLFNDAVLAVCRRVKWKKIRVRNIEIIWDDAVVVKLKMYYGSFPVKRSWKPIGITLRKRVECANTSHLYYITNSFYKNVPKLVTSYPVLWIAFFINIFYYYYYYYYYYLYVCIECDL